MALPTLRDVHIDTALSRISIAYRPPPNLYIADRIFPQVPVEHQSDKFFIWTKDEWFRIRVETRSPNAPYPEAGLRLSQGSYYCDIYHLAFPIPDEVLANQDPAIDLAVTGAEWLADQFLKHREDAFARDFFRTGVWATDRTLAGAQQWSDYANSNPIRDIREGVATILRNTGIAPNMLVVGFEVMEHLRQHPQIIERYKYTQAGVLTEDMVASALGIPVLLVGRAVKNTAQEGASFSGGFIFGKHALLLYTTPNPGLMTPTAGYTFVWPEVGDLTIVIRRVREETRDRELLLAKTAWDMVVVAPDLGYFIQNAVA